MGIAVIDWLKIGPLAGFVLALAAAGAGAAAAQRGDAADASAASPYGAYLAGRHAQEKE